MPALCLPRAVTAVADLPARWARVAPRGGAGGGPINGWVAPVGTTGGAGGGGGGASRFFFTVSQSSGSASLGGAGTPGAPGYVIITW